MSLRRFLADASPEERDRLERRRVLARRRARPVIEVVAARLTHLAREIAETDDPARREELTKQVSARTLLLAKRCLDAAKKEKP